jgi:hypothetical protein
MALHEQNGDFLCSDSCNSGCLHNHAKWTVPHQNKFWVKKCTKYSFLKTKYGTEFSLYLMEVKGYVQLLFSKAIMLVTLYQHELYFLPTHSEEVKDIMTSGLTVIKNRCHQSAFSQYMTFSPALIPTNVMSHVLVTTVTSRRGWNWWVDLLDIHQS